MLQINGINLVVVLQKLYNIITKRAHHNINPLARSNAMLLQGEKQEAHCRTKVSKYQWEGAELVEQHETEPT